jgi:hypothetical protein
VDDFNGIPPDRFSRSAVGPNDAQRGTTHNDPGVLRPELVGSAGKGRYCASCRGRMKKSSRMVLSPLSGALLVALGCVFTAAYGAAVNFLQPPWYVKFCLPAIYYIGSLFIGAGGVFFFIRERVWRCPRCGDISKR